MDITTEDFSRGRGGFWVRADGSLLPVRSYAEHTKVLKDQGIVDHHGFGNYQGAYDRGWIRVSIAPVGHNDTDINLNLDHATPEALKTLGKLLRHENLPVRAQYSLTREEQHYWIKRPEWRDLNDTGEINPLYSFTTDDPKIMARKVMQYAITKSVEQTKAQAAALFTNTQAVPALVAA